MSQAWASHLAIKTLPASFGTNSIFHVSRLVLDAARVNRLGHQVASSIIGIATGLKEKKKNNGENKKHRPAFLDIFCAFLDKLRS